MISEKTTTVLDIFAQGRELYKQRKFKEAMGKFSDAIQIEPEDGPSKVFYARCKYYLENPPGDDWDGVWVMHEK
jgi:hypothetical protein